jgi:hypothetical protein
VQIVGKAGHDLGSLADPHPARFGEPEARSLEFRVGGRISTRVLRPMAGALSRFLEHSSFNRYWKSADRVASYGFHRWPSAY